MIAGVVAVPERWRLVKELEELIAPHVRMFTPFFDDQKRGQWWNYTRCVDITTRAAHAGEPVLIVSDDMITVPDWKQRWEVIHERAQDSIYVLFARRKHLFSSENVARGYVTGIHRGSFYDPATIFIDRQELCHDVFTWFHQGGGRQHPLLRGHRKNHLDVVIQTYLVAHEIPWTISTPSIFDHRCVKSMLGHQIGKSPLYVGN